MKLFLKLRKIKSENLEQVRDRIGDCILIAKSTVTKQRLYQTGISIQERLSQRYYLFGGHDTFMSKLYKKLLITQPRVGTSFNEILALQVAAKELGWDVLSAEGSWRLPDDLIASGRVGVPYGSQTFCEVIAQQMGWKLIQNSFDWLAKLPIESLKRKVQFMTLGEAKKLQETKFIKPADDKVFDAKVYAPGELVTHEVVSDDTPTLVSDIVNFDLEYRCFYDGHYSRTWSNYICYEYLADPRFWDMVPMSYNNEEVLPYLFVDNAIEDSDLITVPSVVDVGRIPGKGWAIIETNQAWASGLYGCDPMQALIVMQNACTKT